MRWKVQSRNQFLDQEITGWLGSSKGSLRGESWENTWPVLFWYTSSGSCESTPEYSWASKAWFEGFSKPRSSRGGHIIVVVKSPALPHKKLILLRNQSKPTQVIKEAYSFYFSVSDHRENYTKPTGTRLTLNIQVHGKLHHNFYSHYSFFFFLKENHYWIIEQVNISSNIQALILLWWPWFSSLLSSWTQPFHLILAH